LLALAAVPVFYLAVPARRGCPVTMAKCARVEVGMSRAEVRAILGVPPGDYTGGRSRKTEPASAYQITLLWQEVVDTWARPDCYLSVLYGEEGGSAVKIDLSDNQPLPEPSIPERVRRMFSDWFGLGSR
jgi:hypothetical protein